jgi:hypothetical protein
MAFVWPGHHYLDPGNKLEEFKPPVDSDDEIALLHDLNYKYAETKEDIREADRTAIGDFFKDWIYNPTHYHSAIGGFLLGGKYLRKCIWS